MEIYTQTNDNGCGIAVTQSLIKYFHGKHISKVELYSRANIGEGGMSIMDLENLNSLYGIVLESYHLPFHEFKALETKEYFILLINRSGLKHYTIAKKRGNRIVLYDSAEGKINITCDDLEAIYQEIYITVKFSGGNVVPKRFLPSIDSLDLGGLAPILLLNLSTFSLSLLISVLMNYGIRNSQAPFDAKSFANLFLSIVLVQIILHLGEHLEDCLLTRCKNRLSKALHTKFLGSLSKKRNSFCRKLGKNQLLLLGTHLENIASFRSQLGGRWIMAGGVLLISLAFLWTIHPLFLPLMAAFGLVQWLLKNSTLKLQNKHLPELMDVRRREAELVLKMRDLMSEESDPEHLNILTGDYGNSRLKEMAKTESIAEGSSRISRINSLANDLIYLCVMFLSLTLMYSGGIHFAHLSIVNFFYNQTSRSISSLGSCWSLLPQYLYSKEMYGQMVHVDTVEETGETLALPESIEIRNLFYGTPSGMVFSDLNLVLRPHTLLYGPSGIGKSSLYGLISQRLDPSSGEIFFGKEPLSSINPRSLNGILIHRTGRGHPPRTDLRNLLNTLNFIDRENALEMCRRMKIDPINGMEGEELSSGQRQLISVLRLLKLSGKILLLDEIASHMDIESKIKLFETIMPSLASRNFLVCIEHTPELLPLFPNSIDLSKHV